MKRIENKQREAKTWNKMEISTLNGITATTGRITGTRYPSLRSSSISPNKQGLVSGNWSHVKRALANDELYNERVKIFKDWFSVWDSPQRCKFFLEFLRRCSPSELSYVEGWFIQRAPILRQDFTSVLPRWISLYIFSFLDPKSLCRASKVSWHWQYLTEQDSVWMPKCIRLGWFLSAVPSRKEHGAWKSHYINCVNTFDYKVLAYEVNSHERASQRHVSSRSPRSTSYGYEPSGQLSPALSYSSLDIVHEDTTRPAWQHATKSPRVLEKDHLTTLQTIPNPPKSNPDSSRHRRSKSGPAKLTGSIARNERGFVKMKSSSALGSSFLKDLSINKRSTEELVQLSESALSFERSPVRLKQQSCSASLIHTQRSFECKSFRVPVSNGALTLNMNNIASENPVVLFISSQMPAKEVLVDSVKFGVISIPYDYEGETLDSLLMKLKNRLAGRIASRIGFCVDGDKIEGTANIIQGATLCLASLKHVKMQEFWKRVSLHLLDEEEACIDFFWPIAASENGIEMLESLMKITGVQISTPIGFTGSLTRMETEWLKETDGMKTPHIYFKEGHIDYWMNYCENLEDTLSAVRLSLKTYLFEEHKKFLDHTIGCLASKLLKIAELAAVQTLCSSLASSCSSRFLESSDEDMLVYLRRITGMITGKSSETERNSENEKNLVTASMADQRNKCAYAIYDLELEYKEKLQLLKDVYIKPLSSSLRSNREILSSGCFKIIFNDSETLESISSELLRDMKCRIDQWSSEQCLGDVYLKFTTNLKAYSNFLRNYPTALKTLQRCREENPNFRAFLLRQKNNVESQNLSIHELLLFPTRINQRRAESLSSLLKCTPSEHKDRQYISKSLQKIREIANSTVEIKGRIIKEEILDNLQARIKNCPPLMLEGRFLIKEIPLSELAVFNGSKSLNGSVYFHTRDVTMFLFNDVMICTRRYTCLTPFSSVTRQQLRYETAVDPQKLRVADIPDTKYFSNALKVSSPDVDWLLQASSNEEKSSILSLLKEVSVSSLPITRQLLMNRR